MGSVPTGGKYKANRLGYMEVLNDSTTLSEMQTRGEVLAASARSQSGIDYAVDSRYGAIRVHTRVSAVMASVHGRSPYLRERAIKALAVLAGTGGATYRKSTGAGSQGWNTTGSYGLDWMSSNQARRSSRKGGRK